MCAGVAKLLEACMGTCWASLLKEKEIPALCNHHIASEAPAARWRGSKGSHLVLVIWRTLGLEKHQEHESLTTQAQTSFIIQGPQNSIGSSAWEVVSFSLGYWYSHLNKNSKSKLQGQQSFYSGKSPREEPKQLISAKGAVSSNKRIKASKLSAIKSYVI